MPFDNFPERSSIAVAEQKVRAWRHYDAIGDWYHACLVLIDENIQPFSYDSLIQQLHIIKGNKNPYFISSTEALLDGRDFSKPTTKFFPLVKGDKTVIETKWGRLTDFFNSLSRKVKYGPFFTELDDSPNCRTAVRDGTKLIGIDLHHHQVMSDAGMAAPSLLRPPFISC